MSSDEAPRSPSLVLILKWGGELTPAGRIQAENLGKAFRTLYPGGQGESKGMNFCLITLIKPNLCIDLKLFLKE